MREDEANVEISAELRAQYRRLSHRQSCIGKAVATSQKRGIKPIYNNSTRIAPRDS